MNKKRKKKKKKKRKSKSSIMMARAPLDADCSMTAKVQASKRCVPIIKMRSKKSFNATMIKIRSTP
jgi:hypothetical protein